MYFSWSANVVMDAAVQVVCFDLGTKINYSIFLYCVNDLEKLENGPWVFVTGRRSGSIIDNETLFCKAHKPF